MAERRGADAAQVAQFEAALPMHDKIRDGVAKSGCQVAEKYGMVKAMPELTLAAYLGTDAGNVFKLWQDIKKIPPLPNPKL